MAIVINGSGTVTGISVGGLPDGIVDAGTLATNSVDSAELIDGSIDTAHIAADQITGAILPTGSVLQVIRAEITNGPEVATDTYTDIGLQATITPISTSSKILAQWSIHCRTQYVTETGYGNRILRGSTSVWSTATNFFIFNTHNRESNRTSYSYSYLDSPSTTSATIYKIQVSSKDSRALEISDNGNQCTIILMEIAG